MSIRKRDIAAYTLLPGVIPRLRDLFMRGFEWIALLMATLFVAVRLLPKTHPYMSAENYGRFGIRHVLIEAYKGIDFKWKNADQVAVFTLITTGTVVLFMQFIVLLVSLLSSTAAATGQLFVTPNPETDAAFMMLDHVFGIPEFFGSSVVAGLNWGDPALHPYHSALHALFEFYSLTILWIAIIIFIYYFVVILGETAATGQPFGARFDTVWSPVRILIGIGLIIPVAYGLNSGQYIVLGTAKLGSSLATNGWLQYNQAIEDDFAARGIPGANPLGEIGEDRDGDLSGNATLLPQPRVPEVSQFVAALHLIEACRYSYYKLWSSIDVGAIRPYLVKEGAPAIEVAPDTGAYTTFEEALEFYDNGDIIIRYGRTATPEEINFAGRDPFAHYPGGILPLCGDLVIPVTQITPILTPPAPDGTGGGVAAGAWHFQRSLFIRAVHYQERSERVQAFAARMGEIHLHQEVPDQGSEGGHMPCAVDQRLIESGPGEIENPAYTAGHPVEPPTITLSFDYGATLNASGGPAGADDPPLSTYFSAATLPACVQPPPLATMVAVNDEYRVDLQRSLDFAHDRLLETDMYAFPDDLAERGWGAAGAWYNRLAAVIGQEIDAASRLPSLARFPTLMEETREANRQVNANVGGPEAFNTRMSDEQDACDEANFSSRECAQARMMYEVNKDWNEVSSGVSLDGMFNMEGNALVSMIHGIFGTNTIVNILNEDQRNVHPMAQLVAIGRDLVNSTMVNILASTGFAFMGGMHEAQGTTYNQRFFSAISGAASSIALVGMSAGFILFYVIPLMPFVYFFFAVGAWVKTIFEAMVGVPLWALAHLRIDGQGLPGDAAAQGYFLILEIFIRPILVIFALVASFIVFGAMARVLHEIFPLVASNVGGFDNTDLGTGIPGFEIRNARGPIDAFFFTVLYTFILYSMALTSFKLIELIPNQILRWIGSGAKSFGDSYQDPAESMTQYAGVGAYIVGQRVMTGLSGAAGFAGQQARQGMGGDEIYGDVLNERGLRHAQTRLQERRAAAAQAPPQPPPPQQTPPRRNDPDQNE